jgi:hypothetical protein
MKTTPMTPEQILAKAFSTARHRTPRSAEYRLGVLAALKYRIEGIPMELPYTVGTAQADAWFAGTDEGHRLYRERGGIG